MGLFREEVLTRKSDKLHGTITLAVPVSWQFITASLAAITITVAAFLVSASYSRTEVASGSVLPTGGILRVVSFGAGRVEEVAVHEGQHVRQGDRLARIRAEQIDGSGVGTQTEMLAAIERQQRGLVRQQVLTRAASASEQSEYGAQISGLRQEVRSINAQIAVQQRLVDMARDDLAQAKQVASRGFISRRDLAGREEALLSRQQQLSAIRQTRAAKLSSIEQALRAQRKAAAEALGSNAALVSSQAQIERERALTRGAQGYSLVAPADGQVAALNIHVGDAVTAEEAAMVIVSSGGPLVARIYIPGKAAGFVRVGQTVRLAFDAYPHERFGTVESIITILSLAPVMRTEKDGSVLPFYVATAAMEAPWVRAYGRQQALLPGMTLTARIVVEHRSLLQWLFDPLAAAAAG